jgi:cytochrome c oxidase assembly factor 5
LLFLVDINRNQSFWSTWIFNLSLFIATSIMGSREETASKESSSGGPCQQIKADLTACILQSDCVLKPPYHTPKECLQSHLQELPVECSHLRYAFFDCKRGMVSWKHFVFNNPSFLGEN